MEKLTVSARITEVDDASNQLVKVYEQTPAVQNDALLKAIFDEMKSLSEQITEAILRDKVKSELEEADNVRDEKVRSLFKVVCGYAAMPMEGIAKSGIALKRVIDKYGVRIVNESYANESSLIESLLQDLAVDELKDDIASLSGVSEAIEALRSAQDVFDNARLSYYNAMSVEETSKVSATGIKKPLLYCINNKLVDYLNIVASLNEGLYGEFAGLIAEEIEKANAAIALRFKK